MPQNYLEKKGARLAKKRLVAPNAQALLPWEIAFGEWLARRPRRPSRDLQVVKANELLIESLEGAPVEEPIVWNDVAKLKRRVEFREYLGLMREGGLKKARTMLRNRYPSIVEAHSRGLDLALRAQDYGTIHRYTNPILHRIDPPPAIAGMGATAAVQVNLTVNQARLIEEAQTPIDVECVEVEEVQDDA